MSAPTAMTPENLLRGGCYCGAVRYQTDGVASHITNCHCTICRRTTGAPFVGWFSVPVERFVFTQGVPTFYHSTPDGRRSFCSTCGTQLTFNHANDPELIDITICSLDDPEQFAPESHIHVSTKIKWVHLHDDQPSYLNAREDG